jgi:hypothetical protein
MARQYRRPIEEEKMININAIAWSAAVAVMVATAAGSAAAEGHGAGRSQEPAPLEGTWQVRIAPYVCATGVPLPPQAEFDSLVTFSAGGTMTETTANPRFLPGQRSIGLGNWERSGRSSYEIAFEAFVQFTGGNYTQGRQRVEQGLDMVDADHWNSTAVVAFSDTAGAPVSSGCMRAVGARMP